MKLGILTFHSQLNYGGVLQCWALKMALNGLGHEVVVLDWWFDGDNWSLNKQRSGGLLTRVAKGLLGVGAWAILKRSRATMRFLSQNLERTGFHFCDWNELSMTERAFVQSLDCIVVGSDQIWNCTWFDPRPFLLEGAPPVHAFAYAASFGMAEVPQKSREMYKRGFRKFDYITCRESEGVKIVGSLGYSAEHVVDPTLLLPEGIWREKLGVAGCGNRSDDLVCYFLKENVEAAAPLLREFTRKNRCRVRLYVSDQFCERQDVLPKSLKGLCEFLKSKIAKRLDRVVICQAAGPIDFLKAISTARWVITDSFHGLMFSIIFQRNVRILKSRDPLRKAMSARLEEFALHMQDGDLLQDNLACALNSLIDGKKVKVDVAWLNERISFSRKKLKMMLEGVI